MKNNEIVEKNLEQHSLFMQYALEHPGILDKIPDGVEIVFLPEDDKELTEINLNAGKTKESKGKKVIYIKIRVKEEKKTVLVPQIELA